MKQIIETLCIGITRRIYYMIFGYPRQKHLAKLLSIFLQYKRGKAFFLIKSFAPELNSFLIAKDIWDLREMIDPFIQSPIIDRYYHEFTTFFKTIEYKPAGMAPTNLLILYCLIRESKPQVVIESGSMNGYSSIFLAEALYQNNNDAKLYCLSLFKNDQKEKLVASLSRYTNINIIEGYSELSIESLISQHKKDKVAILIDGPKAMSHSWDTLNQKIRKGFLNLLFIAFDGAQEHIPAAWNPYQQRQPLNRFLNQERFKVIELFKNHYMKHDYKLTISSNQFSDKFSALNEIIFQTRNNKWGQNDPWKNYTFNRVRENVAIFYKLALICRSDVWDMSNKKVNDEQVIRNS